MKPPREPAEQAADTMHSRIEFFIEILTFLDSGIHL